MEFESFSFNQNCIATGVPTPTIIWTSNTSTFVVADDILSIQTNNLNKITKVNYFTCTAKNSVGVDIRRIRIINGIELKVPDTPILTDASTNSVVIQWSEYDIVDYVSHYEICVSKSGVDGCSQRIETSDTQLIIRDLIRSSQYFITVVVFTDFGTSPKSIALDVIIAKIGK